jgi:hypothetical protein
MTAQIHLYDRNASIAHIHVRLFEPRAFSFARPMFGVPALIKLPVSPPCLICGAEDIPGLMGWVEVFGDQRILTICGNCASVPESELEQALFDKLGLTPAVIGVAAE